MKARNMILTLVFGFQALFISVPFLSEAGDLISVIVADTWDENIGDSTAIDLKKMQVTMTKIARNTNMKLRQVTLSDNETLPSRMLRTLEKLTVKKDDVLIFYFSGHGYRTASKGDSLWPNLYFSIPDEGVEYERVVSLLQKKKPRLLITIADACNNELRESKAPLLARTLLMQGEVEKNVKANYSHLFLETKGMIRITGAEAGGFAWGTRNGGLFTNAFIKSFDRAVTSSSPADWGSILDYASYQLIGEDQVPVYVIETTIDE